MARIFFSKSGKEIASASTGSATNSGQAFEEPRKEETRADDAWTQPSRSGASAVSAPVEAQNGAGPALSVIGPSLVFKGKLSAQEDLLIQGRIEGAIEHGGANLTIGAHGDLKADIVARKVIIQGTVRGDVRASEAIVLEASARVHGNLFSPRVALKDGARFLGSIDMEGAVADAKVNELLKAAG